MKNSEAIKIIKSNYPPENYTLLRKALDLAIQSLSNEVAINITTVDNVKITIPHGEYNRCDNCGMSINRAKAIITGGGLCDGEWACCTKCHDEMLSKGCAFEELGDMTYRQQKY